jgi:hypothetical protein
MTLNFPVCVLICGHHIECVDEASLVDLMEVIIADHEKESSMRRNLFAGEWTAFVQAIDPKISDDEAYAMLRRFERSLKYDERLLQRDAGDELLDELFPGVR